MIKKLSLILCFAFLIAPATVFAQISIIPSTLDNRGFNLEIKPGETGKASLLVTNLSKKDSSIKIYAVDASQTEEGAFSFMPKNQEQKSIGLWVKTPSESISLTARETKELAFDISVPENTSPGAYLGGIAVEELSSREDSQVKISSRIISKIVVRIPGQTIHKYAFSSFTQNEDSFLIELKNEGSSLVTSTGSINLSGWPKVKTPLNYKELQTPQGQTSSIKINWPEKPWLGFYKAEASLRVGQYDFLKNKSVDHESLSKNIQIIIIPWELIAIILILIISVLIIVLMLKKRLANIKKYCSPYIVKEGENIIEIATKHKIKWQLLAKINKIDAPYKVEAGQKILVPKAQ